MEFFNTRLKAYSHKLKKPPEGDFDFSCWPGAETKIQKGFQSPALPTATCRFRPLNPKTRHRINPTRSSYLKSPFLFRHHSRQFNWRYINTFFDFTPQIHTKICLISMQTHLNTANIQARLLASNALKGISIYRISSL